MSGGYYSQVQVGGRTVWRYSPPPGKSTKKHAFGWLNFCEDLRWFGRLKEDEPLPSEAEFTCLRSIVGRRSVHQDRDLRMIDLYYGFAAVGCRLTREQIGQRFGVCSVQVSNRRDRWLREAVRELRTLRMWERRTAALQAEEE